MEDILSVENGKKEMNGDSKAVSAVKDVGSGVPEWNKGKMKIVTERFPVFMGLALGFGILYTFCLYENPFGITYPVMIAGGYGVVVWMLRAMSVKIKRESWFLIAVAVLLGISTCRTADSMLIMFNKTAEFLLAVIFVIHQFYDDRSWSIGKYLSAMAVCLCCAVAAVVYPFCQGREFFKKIDIKRYRTVVRVLAGLAAALPIVLTAGLLLGQADMVFGTMVRNWLDTFFNLRTVLIVVSMTMLGTFGIYCLVSGACMELISADEKMVRTHEPIASITCMSAVGVLYLFFCGIQIVYLFLGKGSLPDGMTYSSYARQGFFQLLFVAVMNLVMVLLNLKFFKKSRFLNGVLTVVCGCTYVMIASAAYRMVLYVGEYHLTYLRVLVLWFLVLLACMMAGVTVLIYRNGFPLFGWCLAVITVFFVGFSFMRPDRVIAEYNVIHVEEWSQSDFTYMTQRLSADAVPVVLEALEREGVLGRFYSGSREKFLKEYYRWAVSSNYQTNGDGIRTLNFSFEAAEQTFRNKGME